MSDGMQQALAGEYAAIYAFGRAGGRMSADQETAREQLAIHMDRRDQLRAWITASGETPVPPSPAYQLPFAVNSAKSARRLLATVELRLIPVYTAMLADSMDEPKHRRWAIDVIDECALQAQFWGAPEQAFPWPRDLPAPV